MELALTARCFEQLAQGSQTRSGYGCLKPKCFDACERSPIERCIPVLTSSSDGKRCLSLAGFHTSSTSVHP